MLGLISLSSAKKLGKKSLDGDWVYRGYKANEDHHWRKDWPEGIDDGDGDADIIAGFSLPKKKDPKADKKETYPWEYDEDVIRTHKSITTAET